MLSSRNLAAMDNSNLQKTRENQGRLGTLHTRLEEEAERIVQWKVSTEVQLNQKNLQLEDAKQLATHQQNNLLELQQNSEQLSHCLVRERREREELESRLENVHRIMDLLKGRQDELQMTVDTFHAMREQLMSEQIQIKDAVAHVLTNTKQMKQDHNNNLEKMRQDSDTVVKRYHLMNCQLETQLGHVMTKNKEMECGLAEGQVLIASQVSQLESQADKLVLLEQQLQSQNHQLDQKQNTLCKMEHEFETQKNLLMSQNTELQSALEITQKNLMEAQENLTDTKAQLQDLMKTEIELQSQKKLLDERVELLIGQNNKLELDLCQTTEQLQTMTTCHDLLADKVEAMNQLVISLEKKLEVASENRIALELELSTVKDDLNMKQMLLTEMSETMEHLNQEMLALQEKLQSQEQTEKINIEQHNRMTSELQDEIQKRESEKISAHEESIQREKQLLADLDSLTLSMREAESEVSTLKSVQVETFERMEELKKKATSTEEHLAEVEACLVVALAEKEAIGQQMILQQQKMANQLANQKNVSETENSELANLVQSTRESLAEKEEKLQQLQQEVQSANHDLSLTKEELQVTQESLKLVTKDLETAQLESKATHKELKTTKKAASSDNKKYERMQNKANVLEAKLHTSKEECQNLNHSMAGIQGQCQLLREEKARLEVASELEKQTFQSTVEQWISEVQKRDESVANLEMSLKKLEEKYALKEMEMNETVKQSLEIVNEAKAKVQETDEVLKVFKRESGDIVSEKTARIATLEKLEKEVQAKLQKANQEHEREVTVLRLEITSLKQLIIDKPRLHFPAQNLTSQMEDSPKRNNQRNSDSKVLHTPSPSTYLPLCFPQLPVKSPAVPVSTMLAPTNSAHVISQAQPPKSGILRRSDPTVTASRTLMKVKRVVFKSPSSSRRHQDDSDCSDSWLCNFSDTDDDAMKRQIQSHNTRYMCASGQADNSNKKPKLEVTPVIRGTGGNTPDVHYGNLEPMQERDVSMQSQKNKFFNREKKVSSQGSCESVYLFDD